jgi:hypothetical protein
VIPNTSRFLPFEINGHNRRPPEEKTADDVIISITPSKKSLERTRER